MFKHTFSFIMAVGLLTSSLAPASADNLQTSSLSPSEDSSMETIQQSAQKLKANLLAMQVKQGIKTDQVYIPLGGLRNVLTLSTTLQEINTTTPSAAKTQQSQQDKQTVSSSQEQNNATEALSDQRARLIAVNDPNAPDDFISRLAGNDQTEPSPAWCGQNIVSAFMDAGSAVVTLLNMFNAEPYGHALSQLGWATSNGEADSYTDRGILFASHPPNNQVVDYMGDPWTDCADAKTFYISTLATVRPTPGTGGSYLLYGVAVTKSTDGGQSFPQLILPVVKPAGQYPDKPNMAVSKVDQSIHIVYTVFDFNTTSPSCPRFSDRTAIEYVHSTDSGQTWEPIQTLDEACGPIPALGNPHVVVDRNRNVSVAWESYPNRYLGSPREIKFRSSSNNGQSFGPARAAVSGILGIGAGIVLQGQVFVQFFLGGMAIDSRNGAIYLVWTGGQSNDVAEPFTQNRCNPADPSNPGGEYCFTDVFVAKSVNNGITWIVSSMDKDHGMYDQFMPTIAVDNLGQIFISYYSRKNDHRNYLLDEYVATSRDGIQWEKRRITGRSFVPLPRVDNVASFGSFGDYQGITADTTQGNSHGVIMQFTQSYLGEPNISAVHLR